MSGQVDRSLRLRLLGHFRLTDADGREIPIAAKKGQALLAYLALEPDGRATRTQLATLLWGERFDEQARASLRQCLFELRKAVPDIGREFLSADGETVALDQQAIASDVREFERSAGADARDPLQRAADLYQGDLLEDFDLREAGFADWLGEARSRLKDRAYDAFEHLAGYLIDQRETAAAVAIAERLVALDPLREQGHRLAMRLYHDAGRRNDALRQYQKCCEIVREALAVEPETETTALFQQIQAGATSESPESETPPSPPTAAAPTGGRPASAIGSRRRWAVVGGAAISLSVAAAAGVWVYLAAPPADECAIPDKPSIAVMAFDNLSGEPNQEYFSDGISEDITTELSGIRKLFVIARHSSFAYKGGTEDVRKIACELGVRYLLEGSVRKADNRVRINAQLIDAATGDHIWAERYDSELTDIFKLQDDVTEKIVNALDLEIEIESTARALVKPTENLDAYDYLLRGRQDLFQVTQSSNRRAREMFRKAVALDPGYARAYANLTWTHLNDWRLGWTDDPKQALGLAYAAARKAVALDDFDAGNHSALGDVYLWLKQHRQAIVEQERALALNRNDAGSYASMGDILTWAGRPEAAIEPIERAMRLNPHYPITYVWYLGHANFLLQRHDAAIRALRQLKDRNPDFLAAHLYLAATYSELGRDDEAQAALAKAHALNPRLSKRVLMVLLPYKEPSHLERVLAALSKVGLPP